MKDQELKDLWQSDTRGGSFRYSEETLLEVISRGSQNVVQQFIRTLRIEQWVNMMAFLVWVVYFVWHDQYLIAVLVGLMNVAFFWGYRNLIAKLALPNVKDDVIAYLNQVEQIVRKFVSHYRLAALVLGLPLYLFVLFYIMKGDFWVMMCDSNFVLINLLGLILAYSLVIGLIQLIYGRKLNKIRKLISTLSEKE